MLPEFPAAGGAFSVEELQGTRLWDPHTQEQTEEWVLPYVLHDNDGATGRPGTRDRNSLPAR